jgi:hypothetical protein
VSRRASITVSAPGRTSRSTLWTECSDNLSFCIHILNLMWTTALASGLKVMGGSKANCYGIPAGYPMLRSGFVVPSRQLVLQGLRLLQVHGVEASDRPGINRREKRTDFSRPSLARLKPPKLSAAP